MKKIIFKSLAALLCAAGLLYLGDYALLRYRMACNWTPYDSVTVQVYYAVPQKTGKMEYDFQSSQQETCVISLFPLSAIYPAGMHASTRIARSSFEFAGKTS